MVTTRRRRAPRSIRLIRVEPAGCDSTLCFAYEVLERDGRRFFAYARALPSGLILDLQASDTDRAGTTGRAAVDALIAERVRRRLANARAGATIAELGRRRESARR